MQKHLTGSQAQTLWPESNADAHWREEYLSIASTRVPGGGGTFFTWENTLMNSLGMEGGLKVELGNRDK